MKRVFAVVLPVGIFAVVAAGLFADEPANSPPKILRIIREELKQGRSGAHEGVEKRFAAAMARAHAPSYIALASLSGPDEVWFADSYPSYAALGEAREKIYMSHKTEIEQLDAEDGELRTSSRTLIGEYQPDLSYLADQWASLRPKNHYRRVMVTRIRPGKADGYKEIRQIVNEGLTKTGEKQPIIVYAIVAGAPQGTYIVVQGFPTMKGLDESASLAKLVEAVGSDKWQRYNTLVADTIMNSERYLFAVSPSMSNMSQDVISADPDFWKPKPAVKKATAPAAGSN